MTLRPDMYIPEEDPPDEAPARELPRWIKPVTLLVVLGLLGAGVATFTAAMPRDHWGGDLEAGLDDAAATGVPVLAFFTADWCLPCRELKGGVLREPDVVAGLDAHFVLVKVDLTRRSGPDAVYAQRFRVRGIPTLIVMDSQGVELDRSTGGGPAMETWIRALAGAG